MPKLIVGCGYLGMRVARQWLAAGHGVAGVVRTPQRAEELQRAGIRAVVADVTRPETLVNLPAAETVLCSVGYDHAAGRSRSEVHVDGLRNVLDALSPETDRLIFISSTGVHGEAGGAWVNEDSPCKPTREAGKALFAAEGLLAGHSFGRRAIVLRLAGLYGPGRLPRAADLMAGRPMAVPAGAYVNLVHVDNAAAVVLAAEAHAVPPCTYVVSDGHPVPRREFYRYLAALLGAPEPQFVEPATEDCSRGHGSKRVDNRRMLRDLKVELAYPTYREGLVASVSAETVDGT
jgi:nucleoside-diphosphate-sugar epimerase